MRDESFSSGRRSFLTKAAPSALGRDLPRFRSTPRKGRIRTVDHELLLSYSESKTGSPREGITERVRGSWIAAGTSTPTWRAMVRSSPSTRCRFQRVGTCCGRLATRVAGILARRNAGARPSPARAAAQDGHIRSSRRRNPAVVYTPHSPTSSARSSNTDCHRCTGRWGEDSSILTSTTEIRMPRDPTMSQRRSRARMYLGPRHDRNRTSHHSCLGPAHSAARDRQVESRRAGCRRSLERTSYSTCGRRVSNERFNRCTPRTARPPWSFYQLAVLKNGHRRDRLKKSCPPDPRWVPPRSAPTATAKDTPKHSPILRSETATSSSPASALARAGHRAKSSPTRWILRLTPKPAPPTPSAVGAPSYRVNGRRRRRDATATSGMMWMCSNTGADGVGVRRPYTLDNGLGISTSRASSTPGPRP